MAFHEILRLNQNYQNKLPKVRIFQNLSGVSETYQESPNLKNAQWINDSSLKKWTLWFGETSNLVFSDPDINFMPIQIRVV